MGQDILRVFKSGTFLKCTHGTMIVADVIYDGTKMSDLSVLNLSATTDAVLKDVTIEGCTFAFSQAFRRLGTKPVVYVQNVDGFRMTNSQIEYGTYGLFLRQVQDFLISGNRVHDTYADGISGGNMGSRTLGMTLARGRIVNNDVDHTGDDGISVGGSYADRHWSQPFDIAIDQNRVRNDSRIGGLIGVYGVRNFEIVANRLSQPSNAAITAVTDTNNDQFPNDNGLIALNHITSLARSPGTRGGAGGPAAILLANRVSAPGTEEPSSPLMQNVRVWKNLITVNDRSGIWLELPNRYDATMARYADNISIAGNDIEFVGSQSAGIDWRGINIIRAKRLTIEHNTVRGFPSFGFLTYYYTCLRFGANRITNSVASNFGWQPMVQIGAGAPSETIAFIGGNEYRKTRTDRHSGFPALRGAESMLSRFGDSERTDGREAVRVERGAVPSNCAVAAGRAQRSGPDRRG
jgi:hypothetical protein